ncbi:hypothetical protein [Helicobacter pylori]|uniref:Uncharacterized protein n=1 Tax=Helicobacter pylori (strain SouthAfrica7) TaxID=907239 RepID=E8QW68_HELPW|nr:hypothetical protein [Helicobacter pylori]ADU84689.1 hypothetical protein HPSA_03450 [Helicobacter pylori SouthAfrica7]
MAYTYNPNNEMNILGRVFNTAVFSNNPAFDITPFDLGGEQMECTFERPSVNRLPAAAQTVASVNIFLPITIKVPILKTSPAYKIWLNAAMQNPILGECTLKDDAGFQYVIEQVSLDFNVRDLVTSTEFTIKGNFYVNQDLIKIPIKK